MRNHIIAGVLGYLLLCFLPLNAQLAITYGGPGNDSANSIQQTIDGGYIVAGSTESFGAGGADFWVLKLDPAGDIVWQRTYGGSSWDEAFSVQQTFDGGYVVAGGTDSYGAGDTDFWVLKLDPTGDIVWQRTYGGSSWDRASSIQQTEDGGYIVAGSTTSFGAGDKDFWVLNLNSEGEITWQHTYGSDSKDVAYSIQQTSDGGYIVVGTGWHGGHILKIDPQGRIEWQLNYIYYYQFFVAPSSVQQANDGGFVVASRLKFAPRHSYIFPKLTSFVGVIKISSTGNIEWDYAYGSNAMNQLASSIKQTSDGGFIVAGFQEDKGQEMLILKLSSDGNIDWAREHGGDGSDFANSVYATKDEGYILAGYTDSFGAGGKDIWVIKHPLTNVVSPCFDAFTEILTLGTCGLDFDEHDGLSAQVTDISSQLTYISPKDSLAEVKIVTQHPSIFLSTSKLVFGANITGVCTSDQQFSIGKKGCGTFDWTLSKNAEWFTCYPISGTDMEDVTVSVDPSGLPPGEYTGTIAIYADSALNSPKQLTINLNVYASDASDPPFGYLDTPIDGATQVTGSIPVSGWALDDIGVAAVEIKREPVSNESPGNIGPDGLVYIGDADFVEGARPDVEAVYPMYPLADRAGWGYMLLTNSLPNQGNGVYVLHAIAYDMEGQRTELGVKTITCDNANAVKPFGTIDTPAQGGVTSGADYVNFGWALTPQPKYIPVDGSTIWVWIDGLPVGHPVYNNYRADIATLFPGYANSDGAVGYYYLDTTAYANGVHNMAWSVEDNEGEACGIGSRYFEVQNVGGALGSMMSFNISGLQVEAFGRLGLEIVGMERGYRGRGIEAREERESRLMGADMFGRLEPITRREDGAYEIEVEELERIELRFRSQGGNRVIGWGHDSSRPLPVGSTLDGKEGVFSWSLGPGFLGRHVLHFAATDGVYRSEPIKIVVNISPKKFSLIR